MDHLSLSNPVFAAYSIAATLMILKGVAMSWLTVIRMTAENGGFRNPEDLKKTLVNPRPNDAQLAPNDRVERIRRIQLNDLENLPYFLVSGLLYVTTAPSAFLAQFLFYAYVVTRMLHFLAYYTAQIHDIRAALWTPGSLIIIYMAASTFWSAVW
ncbi:membrane-associated protein in eicosanoid and glutathione metabolism (MAPEG) [Rhizobium sp. PDO1-076]|uniref:MAPEG family protein n=1 Tax=Rhizobium sp. PDO1-076 TaxID=1125979 RepID=UPI00024E33E5|nr:MAPEG family protein [Rhizobium sp. PDO1-076]EHS52809.1 membrane-associated protein in eicosanoid and glutathione metabolism (MAPEG) [Rhizobium sp. PDO1-076]